MDLIDGSSKLIAYNPSVAVKNLDDFKDSLGDALRQLSKAYTDMMSGLREYWASPKANDFYTISSEFEDIVESGNNEGNSIIASAVSSVSAMAQHISGKGFSYGGRVAIPKPKADAFVTEMDGYIGINVKEVKRIKAEFNEKISGVKNSIEAVKSSIAVEDKNGSIKHIYGQKIADLKSRIDDVVFQVNQNIDKNLEEQETIISSARAKALAILQNTSSAVKTQV